MYAVNLYLVLLGFIIVIPCQVYVLHGVNSQLYHLYSEYATYGRFSYSLTPGSGLASVFSVASTTPVPCSTVPKFCHFLLPALPFPCNLILHFSIGIPPPSVCNCMLVIWWLGSPICTSMLAVYVYLGCISVSMLTGAYQCI